MIFTHSIGQPYLITGKSLTSVWDAAIRAIWTSGERIVDQRGNTTRELLNLVIHISGATNDYPVKCPCSKQYGDDFADGLTKDNSAYEKANAFDYSYGERIRIDNALYNVIETLRNDPTTRTCVLTIYQNSDTKRAVARSLGKPDAKEVPCATQCYLLIRDDKLHMDLMMRSNDYLMAMPSDVFGFRVLQAFVADEIGCKIGSYTHFVQSAHIIEENGKDFMERYMRGAL